MEVLPLHLQKALQLPQSRISNAWQVHHCKMLVPRSRKQGRSRLPRAIARFLLHLNLTGWRLGWCLQEWVPSRNTAVTPVTRTAVSIILPVKSLYSRKLLVMSTCRQLPPLLQVWPPPLCFALTVPSSFPGEVPGRFLNIFPSTILQHHPTWCLPPPSQRKAYHLFQHNISPPHPYNKGRKVLHPPLQPSPRSATNAERSCPTPPPRLLTGAQN